MTTTTPNLSLVLYNSTTDGAEYFSNFRAVVAGVAPTSNFYRIDTAYGTHTTQINSLLTTRGAILTPAVYVIAHYFEANSITEITSYITNMMIILKLDTTSSGSVTLNINALGTKDVKKINSSGAIVDIVGGELIAGKYYLFVYDGTRWIWVDSRPPDTVYVSGTTGNVVTLAADGSLLGTVTPSALLSDTTHAATPKSTPADADEWSFWDSVGLVLKKLTWANIKTALASTFADLASAQVITGAKTFGTIGGTVGKLILAGSTSGSTILNASATAGSTTVVLPAANDTLVALATTDTLTNKRITPRVGSTTSSATPTINTDNYDAYSITALSEAITSFTTNLTGNPTNFQKLLIRIKDDGTARAISWGASFESGTATLPTTTVLGKTLMVGFMYDSVDSKWACEATGSRA
jgi:hypothetical protein